MTTRRAPTAPPESSYRGRTVAVGTRHGKQHQFTAAFAGVLGVRLHTPEDLDTDRFGTFSGERPRQIGALDAARAKAHLAMEVTGLTCGLASEASYGPLPGTVVPGHEEILLFCDTTRDIEIIEGYRVAGVPGPTLQVSDFAEIPRSVLDGLPAQALIVRPDRPDSPEGATIVKGITDAAVLAAAVQAAADLSPAGVAVVEPDLRAQHNPARRRILQSLAQSMVRRLTTECPSCRTPGFGRIDRIPGLPCRVCATPTPLIREEIHGCCRCAFTRADTVGPTAADPADCPICNP